MSLCRKLYLDTIFFSCSEGYTADIRVSDPRKKVLVNDLTETWRPTTAIKFQGKIRAGTNRAVHFH